MGVVVTGHNLKCFKIFSSETSEPIKQTCHRWSLGGQLPKLCSVIPISVQNGRRQRSWSPDTILKVYYHPCHVCFKLADWFQKTRLLNNFPIGSYVKTMSADGGHFEPRSGSNQISKSFALEEYHLGRLWSLYAKCRYASVFVTVTKCVSRRGKHTFVLPYLWCTLSSKMEKLCRNSNSLYTTIVRFC
jgi:hypothetical protein